MTSCNMRVSRWCRVRLTDLKYEACQVLQVLMRIFVYIKNLQGNADTLGKHTLQVILMQDVTAT